MAPDPFLTEPDEEVEPRKVEPAQPTFYVAEEHATRDGKPGRWVWVDSGSGPGMKFWVPRD